MTALIYEREPADFKYPYAFDVPLDSWHELVMANALYDQAGLRAALRRAPLEHVRPWKRALAKVDKEETFHLRHGARGCRSCAPTPRRSSGCRPRGLDVHPHARVVRAADERKRHGIQLEYGFKGMSNDELRRRGWARSCRSWQEVGLDVLAHWMASAG
jgi:ring-1,2-phenylacetyl-CoA epoxidase subunit PaaA